MARLAPDNTWVVEGDGLNRAFLDQLSAASAVLKRQLPDGVKYYELKRQGKTAFVATYPEEITDSGARTGLQWFAMVM